MNVEVLTLAPGDPPIAQSLGFNVRSVLVSNYTSSFLRLPDAGLDIPPFTFGAAIPLPAGLRTGRASLVSVSPPPTGPTFPTTQATLTWLDVDVAPDPGHRLTITPASPRVSLGRIDAAPNTTSPTSNFVLPAGTIAIAVQGLSQPSPPASVSVIGHTTGNVYFNIAPGTAFNEKAIDPSVDASVDVTITSPAALASACSFLAITGPVVRDLVTVAPGAFQTFTVTPAGGALWDVSDRAARLVGHISVDGQPIVVRIQDWSGGTTGPSIFVDPSGFHAVTVSQQNPRFWQAPTNIADSGRITVNTSTVIVAAVPSQNIRIFGWEIAMDGSTGGCLARLTDGVGTTYAVLSLNGTANGDGAHSGNLSGVPLPANSGLLLVTDSVPAGGGVRATVSYSQA